jgi:hypothetical protein
MERTLPMTTARALLLLVCSICSAAAACHHTGPVGDGAPDGDTDADGDTDVDADSDADGDSDTDADTDTLDDCPDPCLDENDEPITGCLDECGGMADIQCESAELECAYMISVLDGMGICLPPQLIACGDDDDCACLAVVEHGLCETIGDPAWVCTMDWGVCAIECE